MARRPNTRNDGSAFDSATVAAVWAKARLIPNYDPNVWRHDACGAVMKRIDYGNTQSGHGWEIDHVLPVAKGGGDALSNLQPLQWGNNRRKGDTLPWSC